MKEQIIAILKKYEGLECLYQFNSSLEDDAIKNKALPENIADEIIALFAERMPTEEQCEEWMKDNLFGSAREFYKWFHSRMEEKK